MENENKKCTLCLVCKIDFKTGRRLSSHLGRYKSKDIAHGQLHKQYWDFVLEQSEQGKTQKEIIQDKDFPFDIGFVQTVWKTLDPIFRQQQKIANQEKGKNRIFGFTHSKPSKQELFELYIVQKLTCKDIALQLNFNSNTIESWIKKYKFNKRNQIQKEREEIKLTSQQESLLLGTSLGDGHIRTVDEGRAQFRWCHGIKQKDYLLWKVSQVQELFPFKETYNLRSSSFGKDIKSYSIASIPMSSIKHIHNLIYDTDGIRHITQEVLERLGDLGFAIWFQDDGSLSSDLNLHVCKFSPTEIDLLISFLSEKYSIHAIRTGKPQRYVLTVSRIEDIKRLLERWIPYKFIDYKFNLNHLFEQRDKIKKNYNRIITCKQCNREMSQGAKGLCRTCYKKTRKEAGPKVTNFPLSVAPAKEVK